MEIERDPSAIRLVESSSRKQSESGSGALLTRSPFFGPDFPFATVQELS